METLGSIILFHQIVKVQLVQLTSLCKATGSSCKVMKLYEAAELSCKVTKSYDTINDEGLSVKPWQPRASGIFCAPKF